MRAQTAPESGASNTRYTTDQKLAILRAYAASPEDMRDFCARHQLTTTTLCAWRKRFDEEGEAGLQPRPILKSTSWRAQSLIILDPSFSDGRQVLTGSDLLSGFDFCVDHVKAGKLLKNLYDVHSGATKSLEDFGFDTLSQIGYFFSG